MRRIFLAVILGLACTGSYAETITLPTAGSTSSGTRELPSRGMTMQAVRAKFGEPAQRQAAVGVPPITRWDYGDFIVVFEHQHVISAIMPGHLHSITTPTTTP
jgi:hypothetical protein